MHGRSRAVAAIFAALDADAAFAGKGARFRISSISAERLPGWSVYSLRSRVRRDHQSDDGEGGIRTIVIREFEIGVTITVKASDGLDEDLDVLLARAEQLIFAAPTVLALCHDGAPEMRGDEIRFDRELSADTAGAQLTVAIIMKTPEGDPETIIP